MKSSSVNFSRITFGQDCRLDELEIKLLSKELLGVLYFYNFYATL